MTTRTVPWSNDLELIFLERLEGGRPASKGVVFGNAVKNVDPAVVQQCGLRDGPPRGSGTDRALLQRLFADLLNRLEAVAFSTFVFVKRHGDVCSYHIEIAVTTMHELVTTNFYWYKILCCSVFSSLRKNPGPGLGFFLASPRGE